MEKMEWRSKEPYSLNSLCPVLYSEIVVSTKSFVYYTHTSACTEFEVHRVNSAPRYRNSKITCKANCEQDHNIKMYIELKMFVSYLCRK